MSPRHPPGPGTVRRGAYRWRRVIGERILSKLVDLRLEGMVDGEEITATLIAAVFADALRKGQSPRTVLDYVWEALPACDAWENGIEADVRAAVELVGG